MTGNEGSCAGFRWDATEACARCYGFENMLLSAAAPEVLSLPLASEPGGCVKFVSVAILEMRNFAQPLSNPQYDLPCLGQPTPNPKHHYFWTGSRPTDRDAT
jgi:hypothetical protein